MSILDYIVRQKKAGIRSRFLSLRYRKLPADLNAPVDPVTLDAMEFGYRMGLIEGYGEGLADGVDLGLDVGTSFVSPTYPTFSFPEPFDVN
jgi:hypothetical protein